MLMRNMLFSIAFLFAANAWAGDDDVIVKNAWTTETAPGQTKAIVRMDITCTTSYGKLVTVESPVAASGGIERLRPLHGRMAVQVLSSVQMRHNRVQPFSERSVYLALYGLKQQLEVGQIVPVTLTILTAGKKLEVDVNVEVRAQDPSYKAYEDAELQKQGQ